MLARKEVLGWDEDTCKMITEPNMFNAVLLRDTFRADGTVDDVGVQKKAKALMQQVCTRTFERNAGLKWWEVTSVMQELYV